MKRSIVIAGTLLALVSGSKADEKAKKETVYYSEARKILLSRGFHPYVMPGADRCAENSRRCYPELVDCTSKRRWRCDYTWKLQGVVYQVEASGEDPIVDSFYCLVNCTAAKTQTLALEDTAVDRDALATRADRRRATEP